MESLKRLEYLSTVKFSVFSMSNKAKSVSPQETVCVDIQCEMFYKSSVIMFIELSSSRV